MITYSFLAEDSEARCDCCDEHLAWSYEFDDLNIVPKGKHLCDACHHICVICDGPNDNHDDPECSWCLFGPSLHLQPRWRSSLPCARCGGPRDRWNEVLCDRCLEEDDRIMAVAS